MMGENGRAAVETGRESMPRLSFSEIELDLLDSR